MNPRPAQNPYSVPPGSAAVAAEEAELLPTVCKVVLEVDILLCALRAWSAAMAWLGEPLSMVEWTTALAIGVTGIRGNWFLLKGRRSGQAWLIAALALTLVSIGAEAVRSVSLATSADLLPGVRDQRLLNVAFWAGFRGLWWLQCTLVLMRLMVGGRWAKQDGQSGDHRASDQAGQFDPA